MLKPKQNRKDKKYESWIKSQPCCNPKCIGLQSDIVPAHMRILGNGGTSLKPPDFDLLPLCFYCHADEHKGSITFWGQKDKVTTKEFVQKICDEHLKRYKS